MARNTIHVAILDTTTRAVRLAFAFVFLFIVSFAIVFELFDASKWVGYIVGKIIELSEDGLDVGDVLYKIVSFPEILFPIILVGFVVASRVGLAVDVA
jgi:hypothetical protein